MSYERSEINEVVSDIEQVLEKIDYRITTVEDNIRLAKAHLIQSEALTFLNNAQNEIDKISFVPIIDTLEGIIENG
jgi:hypothetical protein